MRGFEFCTSVLMFFIKFLFVSKITILFPSFKCDIANFKYISLRDIIVCIHWISKDIIKPASVFSSMQAHGEKRCLMKLVEYINEKHSRNWSSTNQHNGTFFCNKIVCLLALSKSPFFLNFVKWIESLAKKKNYTRKIIIHENLFLKTLQHNEKFILFILFLFSLVHFISFIIFHCDLIMTTN